MVAETDLLHPIETEVRHTSKMEAGPHPSKENAATTIKVTPQTIIEVPTLHTTTETPTTGDMEVTPTIKKYVTVTHEIYVITPTSIDPSVHLDEKS